MNSVSGPSNYNFLTEDRIQKYVLEIVDNLDNSEDFEKYFRKYLLKNFESNHLSFNRNKNISKVLNLEESHILEWTPTTELFGYMDEFNPFKQDFKMSSHIILGIEEHSNKYYGVIGILETTYGKICLNMMEMDILCLSPTYFSSPGVDIYGNIPKMENKWINGLNLVINKKI